MKNNCYVKQIIKIIFVVITIIDGGIAFYWRTQFAPTVFAKYFAI